MTENKGRHAKMSAMASLPVAEVPMPSPVLASRPRPAPTPHALNRPGVTAVSIHETGTDGMSPYQRMQLLEEQIKLDFGFNEKLAAVGMTHQGNVRSEFAQYRSSRLKGVTLNSLQAVVSSLPIVKTLAALPANVTPVAKAIPAPATDDNGTPVKTAPVESASDMDDLINEILSLIQQLKGMLPADADDDNSEVEAKAFIARGKKGQGLRLLAQRAADLARVCFTQDSQSSARAVARSDWFKNIRATPAPVKLPSSRLPTLSATAASTPDLNALYREELALLDQEISALVASSSPISQEILGRRNRINREWIALNRR